MGGGTIFSYDGAFGFMGLFILRAECRGRGWGGRLWRARRDLLLRRLAPGAAIGMDGVVTMVPFYARGGFVESHRDVRFTGLAEGADEPGVVEVASIDDLIVLDEFETDRRRFLRAWTAPDDVRTVAAIDDGRAVGVGVLRPCERGHRFGPIIADSPGVARRMVSALMWRVEGAQVQLDVPACNDAALSLAAEWNMTSDFECARMYLGPQPVLDMSRVFGVTSFEFG